MVPYLYLSELFTWLKTNEIWSRADKFKLVLWLFSFAWTTLAIIFIALAGLGWLIAGLYALNYPALWMFQPAIVKNHKFAWRRNYENP